MSVMEVVQQQRYRDLLQPGELDEAKRVADNTEATVSLATQKAVDAKVFQHMDEASRIRLQFSLPEIAAGVASMTDLTYKPSFGSLTAILSVTVEVCTRGGGLFPRKSWCLSC